MYNTKHSTMHNKHAQQACMTSAQQACITCMRDISITPCTTCMLDNTTYAQHNKHLVLSIHTAPAAACMVPQVLQRSVAEEVEAVGIIVPAIHATHPEHAVARLQEGGFQALHLALPHLHLSVVPEEVAQLAQLLHLHTCHVYMDRHMDRHGNIHVRDFFIPIHKHRHTHMDVCKDSHIRSSFPGSVLSWLCEMTSPDDVHSDRAVCYFVKNFQCTACHFWLKSLQGTVSPFLSHHLSVCFHFRLLDNNEQASPAQKLYSKGGGRTRHIQEETIQKATEMEVRLLGAPELCRQKICVTASATLVTLINRSTCTSCRHMACELQADTTT